MLQKLPMGSTKLLPGLFKERQDLNKKYLLELDNQCLLQNFLLEAGVILPGLQIVEDPATANLHWGWEAPNCQLRGHFLGHFMSAASVYIATDNDRELRAKLEDIVDELAHCQELNGGEWVGSIPEKYFEKLARNDYIWSPQYTMHKTILGLMHTYEYAHMDKALDIIDHLADWYLRWTEEMQKRNPHAVYSGEEGGMLEVWAHLFEITGNEKYRTLADRYCNPSMFRKLLSGWDPLSNSHANASIPLSHGAAAMYAITGDEKYKQIVEAFWEQAVEKRGSYITGSSNSGEFWTPPHMQGRFMGERTQEFCTVYNMVRTAMTLYTWTGDPKYADYIEKSLYNGFLAQQNAETGMPTYFLPLKAGSRKKWGTKTKDFWCCYGTMVQGQSIYGDLIYTTDQEGLYVAQYIPSQTSFIHNEKSITFTQDTNMKYYHSDAFFDETDTSEMSRWSLAFTVTAEEPVDAKIRFRIPSWQKGAVKVTVGDESVLVDISKVGEYAGNNIENKQIDGTGISLEKGCLVLKKNWKEDTITLLFTPTITTENLPDRRDLYAFKEGPVVLAGLCEGEKKLDIDINRPENFLLPQTEHTYETFPWMQSHFRTTGQQENLEFVPLYEVKDEAYTVYFPIV